MAGKFAIIELAAGTLIFGPDQTPQNFILLIEGSVRVQLMSEDGPYTWELVSGTKAGRAVFTQPPTPIKCAGAPQKRT